MSEQLSKTQIDAINRFSADQRYDYFVNKIIEQREVWGLSSDEGWVILSDEGDEHLPIWPHPELAALWVTGDYADCQPKSISLDDWLAKWLPGMEKDALLAAISPDTEGESIVVSAEELGESIRFTMAP